MLWGGTGMGGANDGWGVGMTGGTWRGTWAFLDDMRIGAGGGWVCIDAVMQACYAVHHANYNFIG